MALNKSKFHMAVNSVDLSSEMVDIYRMFLKKGKKEKTVA